MAKIIRLSDDNGTTWYDLPGGEGDVAFESEAQDDTIFGDTYKSEERALIGFQINANGIYKGFPGYSARIRQPGTPVTVTGEACAQVSGQIYQITDTARRIIDRTATIVVDDNAVDETANVASIDYLFGRITFAAGYTVNEPVTIDMDYIPLANLAQSNSYTLTMTADEIDDSDFVTVQANGGYRTFSPGLRSVALELGGIFDDSYGAKAILAARTEYILDIDPAGDGLSVARGFFKLAGASQGGAVGALEEETLNFMLSVPVESTAPASELPFSWQHLPTTTLDQSIQVAIASYLQELNTYDAQYLPQGVPGQSPLDGIQANVIFTDISLSGGLTNMNIFTMGMRGVGAHTLV